MDNTGFLVLFVDYEHFDVDFVCIRCMKKEFLVPHIIFLCKKNTSLRAKKQIKSNLT